MKRCLVLLCIIFFTSSLACIAKGPAGVHRGAHNLSGATSSTPGPSPGNYNTDEDSICVFCHTPHGGSLNAALWNRETPSSTWKHYNSATMSTTLKGLNASRTPGAESLLCLSCHDGSVAVNHVLNTPNDNPQMLAAGGVADSYIVDFFGNPGSRIGGEVGSNSSGTGFLTDDHPISFSYTAVEGSTEYQSGAKAGNLHPKDIASTSGVRFFGGTDRVECSSCHDPHVNYADNAEYTPFLIMSNSGSALCLSCHIK